MTTVFVYEDVTATGAGGDLGSPPAPSLLAEGRAMLDAVTADFAALDEIQVVTLGEPPGVSGRVMATAAHITRRLTPGGSPGFLELAARADFTLVIAPECAGRLEHLCREVLRVGGRLLGPSPEAVGLTADKLALSRHWDRFGIPTPTTWPLGNEPTDIDLVVKPRDGAGSQATAMWDRFPTCPDRLETCPTSDWPGPLITQQFIPGFAASVAFLVGPSVAIPLVPCEQILSTDGKFHYLGGRLPIDPDLAVRATRIAKMAVRCVPGLLGYVGADVILGDDGQDRAIEINPRLTTSYIGLRALARFNLAATMLAVVCGESPPKLGWHDRTTEFTPDGGFPLGAQQRVHD